MALLAVLALAGCAGGPTAGASHTPTPSPQPSLSPYPSPLYTLKPPSPSPSPRPPLSATLHCRLPISAGSSGSGGFLVFPGGKFVADPTSNVVIPNVPTPSPTSPYNYGPGNFFGLSYDRRYSKWLPVPRQLVSPDESHYVYTSSDSVYVVSVANGTKVELGAGMGHGWTVLGVESEGVYANPQQTSSLPPAGLWLLPFSGAPRQITTKGYWQSVGGGAAYGYDAPALPLGAVQPLLRLDLKTGKTSTWVDNLPPNSSVQGFDTQGHPIVNVQSAPMQIVVLTGVNRQVAIYDGSLQNFYLSWGILADRNGIWLASGSGLYMWTGVVGQIEQVSPVSGPMAGPCA
jgi:hypothetical protein